MTDKILPRHYKFAGRARTSGFDGEGEMEPNAIVALLYAVLVEPGGCLNRRRQLCENPRVGPWMLSLAALNSE